MMELVAATIHSQWEIATECGTTRPRPKDEVEFRQLLAREVTRRVKAKIYQTEPITDGSGYDLSRSLKELVAWSKHNPKIETTMRALLESQLVLTWTAFETLAEDTWKAATAGAPDSFTKKPTFRRLRDIQQTYEALVPTSDWINSILADVGLRQLNLVRHVLVHKSGIVDQKFLDDAAEIGWNHGEVLDQPLRVNGVRVRDLANPVIFSAQQLIRGVDRWMKERKNQ